MAWNDLFDNTTDWSAASFLNMFTAALWEKAEAAVGPGVPQFPVSVGDDVQSSTFIGGLQGYVVTGILGFAGANRWLKPPFNPEGQSAPAGAATPYQDLNPFWESFADVQDAAGYNPCRDSAGRPFPNLAEQDVGWVRKKRRGIGSTSDTVDLDGNTVSDGMRAELLVSGIGFQEGEIYLRTSGAWVKSPRSAGLADELTSAAGSPRAITDPSDGADTAGNPATTGMRAELGADIYVYDGATWVLLNDGFGADRLQSGSGCMFGTCQPGDFIGPWIFNQIRDVLNAIGNRTDANPSTSDADFGSGTSHYDDMTGLEPVYTTEAAAYADMSGRWSMGAGSASTPYAFVTMASEGTVHSQFPSIVSHGEKGSLLYTVSAADHVDKSVIFFGAFNSPGTSDTSWNYVYDAQGEGVTSEDTFHVWEIVDVSAGTTDATSRFLTNTGPPPHYENLPEDDPSSPDYRSTSKGFVVGQTRAIIEWAFTYGP